ncbi:MAG: RNA polymerase sigma factor [Nocardioides sp.]
MSDQRAVRFELLAREVMEPVRRFLARRTDHATADDVLADTLLVLWRRLADVPESGALPWAYATARHCLANAERDGRRQRRVAERVAQLDPPGEHLVEPNFDPDLAAALAGLSDTESELIRLWAWEQLTPAEIAQVLGITANAVSIRLHRARRKLAAALERGIGRKDRADAGHEGGEGRRHD